MLRLELAGAPAIAGGSPAFDEFLVFGQPVLGDEEVEAVAEVIRSRWIGQGERCEQFEEAFAAEVGARHAVSLSSCTAALHAGLVAHGVGPADEVITTALTFVATVHAIVHAGASPVLADVDPETLNLDPDEVRRKITPRTRAVVPVHFGGLPCELDELRAIAREHGLVLLEDAAHALGARHRGAPIGSSGSACFSLYANKNITTAEGGVVATEDEEVAELLRSLRLHGLSRDAWERFRSKRVTFSDAVMLGFKYNFTDLQAALGLVQLPKLEAFLEARRALAARYDQALAGVEGLRAQPRPWNDELRHSHHLYVVEVDERRFGMGRDELLAALRAENIGAGVHYRAVHLHPYYREALALPAGALPAAERLSSRVLSLPLSPAMTDEDVDRVAAALSRIQRHSRSRAA
jgi:dTDP-4-amino-4,6-dideoxygalactose transaminase